MTTQTPGMLALQFQRQLGLRRYETVFQVLHKLRAGMNRPNWDRIDARRPVRLGETLLGGKRRREGRGVHHKMYITGAVELHQQQDKRGRHTVCACR